GTGARLQRRACNGKVEGGKRQEKRREGRSGRDERGGERGSTKRQRCADGRGAGGRGRAVAKRRSATLGAKSAGCVESRQRAHGPQDLVARVAPAPAPPSAARPHVS